MNKDALAKLFSMLPDSKRKQKLVEKYKKLQSKSTKRGGEGLQDTFEFKPVGHIKIEAIDESGEVVGTLADQPNLVVDGAEEILLRSFSGDPSRILYKNRIPKVNPTDKIYIEESLLLNSSIADGEQLLHDPNIIWSAVKDENFEVSYGYYPITVYIKEEASLEPGKRAFVLSKTALPGFAPLNAEIYSTYTNMFIGLGDGKNYKVDLSDSRLTYSEGFSPAEGKAITVTEGNEIVFEEKISNFAFDYEVSNKGSQIDVFVNDVLKETIETLNSELSVPEIRKFELNNLNEESATNVRIVHSGSESGVTDAEMVVVGIYFDALSKDRNSLIKEFENFVLDFDTPTIFNTTPMGPYTVQLPNYPVKEDSVVVKYNDSEFKQVELEEDLVAGTFMVDHLHGILRFSSALTGLMVTYSVTGEILDVELSNGERMTAGNVVGTKKEQLQVTNDIPLETVDGVNRKFTATNGDILDGTLVVKVDGITLEESDISTIDLSNGEVELVVIPSAGASVTLDYEHIKTEVINHQTNDYVTDFEIKEGTARVIDQDGNELVEVTEEADFDNGKFMVDKTDEKIIHISLNKADGEVIKKVEVVYASDEKPGVPTNYARSIIQKPKSINEYPWFELDNGSVRFVADFDELNPNYNITIREMGLFDGPRTDDKIVGFRNFPVKAFSLVRLGDTRKDVNTGIRVTWTITLVNNDGIPFQGGNN